MVNRVAAGFACIVVALVGWSFAFAEDAKVPPSLGQRYKDFNARTDAIIVVARHVVGKADDAVGGTEIACCVASQPGQAEKAFAVQFGNAYVDFENIQWCQETIERMAGAIKAESDKADSIAYRHRGLSIDYQFKASRDRGDIHLAIDSKLVLYGHSAEQLVLLSALLKQSREKLVTLGAK